MPPYRHHLRCYAHPRYWRDGVVTLDAASIHHLVGVMRAAEGDEVEVFDGAGIVARAVLEGPSDSPLLRVLDTSAVEHRGPHVTLVQALPKGRLIESIVEKATELGVGTIRPVIATRVIARPGEAQCLDRRARWERIARSAARQCRTPRVPSVHAVCGLAQALQEVRGECDLLLVACLHPDSRPLPEVLGEARARRPLHVALLIGPEGDWTADEVAAMVEAGAAPVTFGSLVLRVETAALFGLSALAYEFGRSPWGRGETPPSSPPDSSPGA